MKVAERAAKAIERCSKSCWYEESTRTIILRLISTGKFPHLCTVNDMMNITGRSYYSVYSEMQSLSLSIRPNGKDIRRKGSILVAFENSIPHRYMVDRRDGEFGGDRRRR